MSELPSGWSLARLPELIASNGTFVDGDWVESKDQDPKGDVRLIQLADIGDGRYINKSNRFLTHEKALDLGCTFLKNDDILIARMPDPLGRACIFPGDRLRAVTVVDVCIIRGRPEHFDKAWLMHFINSPSFRTNIHSLQSGSTRKRISRGNLSTLNLPIPPRAEQTRIVAKLEELLSDLEAGVAELKAAQKKLAQYRQSLLEDVSQCTLLGDVQVEETMLGEIVISIGQGWSPKCENHPSASPKQWAVIKTTAIQPLSFDGSHNKQLPVNLSAREHLELQDGDLLVTRAGPRNRVGITCLVKSPRSRLILCDKAYRLKVNEAKALPPYIELVLNSPRALQAIDTLKSGINDSGLNLTQDRFFTLPIKLPTLQVQQVLVNAFRDANIEICDFESVIERALSQAAAQRQNILRAAFAGQLVPQDPNDEPASVLLERIRAERATQVKPKARGRKKITT